ncbi:B12-binding domain-containing radical SAM protein [Thermodesulfobacteriota bacterium]
MQKVKVYLTDLRHDHLGVIYSDCMPLGIGYMKAVMDRDLPGAEASLFAYPHEFMARLKEDPPDVLMLTNYMWNEALSYFFARVAKQLKPDMLVVMGGPNIPLETERQLAYMQQRPDVDLYILGEGDFLATELVQRFMDCGLSADRLLAQDLAAAIYKKAGDCYVATDLVPRTRDLDDIPSPWLEGLMDNFFDGRMAPLYETNRGCPFTCTYCCQGTKYYAKVKFFSLERLREEIHYIGKIIHEQSPMVQLIRLADPNYGMFERDIDIAEYFGETQKLYNFPLFIDATTGKNRPDRVIKAMEKVSGAMIMWQSIQSLDETVLFNVKRKNIKLKTFDNIRVYLRGRGMRSSADLILCLPGETLQSHVHALQTLVNSGVDKFNNYQAMLLKGSNLETGASREQYGFQSKYRVIQKNFGVYDGRKVFDIEEIIVATETMPFEDYLQARLYHLAVNVFWNTYRFDELRLFLEKLGIDCWEWIEAIVGMWRSDSAEVRQLVEDFLEETRGELFDTEEELVAFYNREDNFGRLERVEIGDNVVHKYRVVACFYRWPAICAVAFRAARSLAAEAMGQLQLDDAEHFWQDLEAFIHHSRIHGNNAREVLANATAHLNYDISRWVAEKMPEGLERFRLSDREAFEFSLPEETARNLEGAFKRWPDNLSGLTILTRRIKNHWQFKGCRPAKSGQTAGA